MPALATLKKSQTLQTMAFLGSRLKRILRILRILICCTGAGRFCTMSGTNLTSDYRDLVDMDRI